MSYSSALSVVSCLYDFRGAKTQKLKIFSHVTTKDSENVSMNILDYSLAVPMKFEFLAAFCSALMSLSTNSYWSIIFYIYDIIYAQIMPHIAC